MDEDYSLKMIRCTQEMFKSLVERLWNDHAPGVIRFCVNDEWHSVDDPDPSHFCEIPSYHALARKKGTYTEISLPSDYYHPRVLSINYFWKQASYEWKGLDEEVVSSTFTIITEKDISPSENGLVDEKGLMSGDVTVGFIRNNMDYLHYTKFTDPDSLEIIVKEQIQIYNYTRVIYWRMYRKNFELIPEEMRG